MDGRLVDTDDFLAAGVSAAMRQRTSHTIWPQLPPGAGAIAAARADPQSHDLRALAIGHAADGTWFYLDVALP